MRTHCLTALVLVGLGGVLGGCASSFRYDPDDTTPPPAQRTPTTAPSNEGVASHGLLRQAFIDYPVRVYDYLRGQTPSKEALALEDSKLPDRRRMGVYALVDEPFGKRPPYTTRYGQIARFDSDPTVRASAIRALNRSRDGSASGLFVAALADESPAVRLEAAKALANVPNASAEASLLKVFRSATEELDVRIAAADALRQHRSLEVARALVNVLSDREFSLAWQARQSLRTLTGADERYDQAAWLRLITSPDVALG
ncbi:MAG TPA: HEAT repeat domain-containing protein [Tepidisphaeraceae bacterium]